ncbi:neuron navigator 2-like isoform X8 [Oncorhynchus keta]|uniref:neuron navigator 2-like isoform X8 n=1 Tax=Oncorhynchus keta TaxID=8018 RepID=UPI00227D20E9|nr:neuron navigator 2-like isoform X8 [Oncorhynchus keta]
MLAILVASKMKSGLPKPVHSALPIPQAQNLARSRTSSPHRARPPALRHSPLKALHRQGEGQGKGETTPTPNRSLSTAVSEDREDPQIYTDWANHYLVKSGRQRLIKDLQQDVTDGVLLAEIIQVVANEKIEDINGYPKSQTQMIENINTCLGFLAAKGVNIQGLSAEEILHGNLKTILGLFFSLSRYKQQQQKVLKQQASHHPEHSNQPGHTPHGSPAPAQTHTHHTHSSTAPAHKAASDMLSSLSSKASSTQSKGLKLSVAQRKYSRLPAPTMRVSAPGSEGKPRAASNGNRRSQSFNHYDKPKPSSSDRERSSMASSIMTEHGLSPGPINGCSSSSIPQPDAGNSSKPWRSKSLNVKHSATSSMLSVKQDPPTRQPVAPPLEVPPKVIAQKSMLEKLKLFNTKGTSKAAGVLTDSLTGKETEAMEVRPTGVDPLEEANGNSRPPSSMATSPKLALKGIAQRTFSRALTPRKSSLKTGEEKDKARLKERDKAQEEGSKLGSVTEQEVRRDNTRQEVEGSDAAEPKRNAKITSFIPKGGKAGSGTKESSASAAHSGIPKPGSKAGKTSSGRDGERPRTLRAGGGGGLSVHKGQLDSRSSCSSLAASEGRSHYHHTNGVPPVATTASNTISVQLPHPQQQYNHPNTATVAPFMYRSQPDVTGADMMEAAGSLECHRETAAYSKSAHNSLSDLTGEDPEARRLRTVKNIADLRQNLEETMSSLRGTQISHSYMTDGGLSRYTHCLNRLPDGMAAVRETLHRNTFKGQGDSTDSWDDSSSVSSGISDTFDTDDINTSSSVSSYVNTPSVSCKDLEGQLQTDAEKHSAVEQNSVWSGSDEVKRSDGGSDSGFKMESGSKWCRRPSDMSDESGRSSSDRKTPSMAHTGSWRRGLSAQVGVTSPRTKAPVTPVCGTLKTHGTGKTDDTKVSEKGQHHLSPRANSSMQRSPSDTGRSSGDEAKKTPSTSSSSRTPTTNTFGFKKHAGGGMTMVTASGVTITGGSATLGKIPKSVQLHGGRGLGRQASVDDGYLPVSSHSTLQYRSLPRPSRASGGVRSANRSSSTSIESNLSSRSNTHHGPKSRSQVPKPSAGGIPLPGSGSNQTDKEKGVSSEANPMAQGSATLPPQGARQPGGKYPDISSPTLRRLFGGKQAKQQAPVTTAENMKNSTVISNPHANSGQQGGALDSPSASSGGSSPLYGGGGRLGVEAHSLSPLASSPGSALSTPSHSLAWSSTMSRDTLSPGYPSLSSLATSSESIDVSLGSGGHGHHGHGHDTLPACVRNNGLKAGISESLSPLSSPSASPKFSRNTLPRKQDRYGHLPQLRSHDDPRDWLRSHSAGGLQESAGSSPFSPASSLTSPSGARFNFSQLAGSPTTAAQINLANLRSGLANQEGPYDPYSERLRNSSMSLEEKSRTMSSSGSFRDGLEEVHGSSLSLVSSTSSAHSMPEEKSQSEIRKLRRELDASQEKVSGLTTQLSANAHLVAAFEQSLGNMTIRLQGLTTTAEQKDSELNDLRKTVEHMKKQNTAAQAAIDGVINLPELTCKGDRPASANGSPQSQQDLCIRRQHSSDSVSSITSATSHSSVGSNLELDAKNKKTKKNWLRSSFKQAFGKKKSSKSASSHSDVEEMADCSLPSSPKLTVYNGSTASTPMIRKSHSNSLPFLSPLPVSGRGWGGITGVLRTGSLARISECTDSEAETVMALRSELRDKEMKLTDIRLEALSSAHQLDQLRESMNRMQGEIEKLKTENDCLKMESQGSCSRAASQASVATPSAGQPQHSLALTESTSLDMLLEDNGDGSSRKEGRHVKVVVTLDEDAKWKEERRPRQFLIGCIGVSGKTKWDVLDGVVRRLFKEYIIHVDPVSQLGLNSDSVLGYSIGDIHRTRGTDTPELLPCGYLVGDSDTISVSLKGVCEHSQDDLVFETLIPKPLLQRYVSQLHEHRRIILSGPSGTGKSFLASRLAEHIVLREGREVTDGTIATFNVDHKSSKELRQYLSNLADHCNSTSHGVDMPLVVVLDNLHNVSSLGEVFNGLLSCKHHRCPYIIGTMNQATSSTPNLQLHHNFRWVLCANHTEPVKGFLGRFLRRRLMETEISSRQRNAELVRIIEWIPTVWHHLNRFLESHSSSDVTIGPRLFLSCPMDVEGSRVWFTDLWNYSIIPYMLEAVREGLQMYGRRAPWEDPARWVMESYPWAASPLQHEWPQLLQLRPEDVGFDGYSISKDGCPRKQLPQGCTDRDPLMNMLMRLKEAAHCSGSTQSYDSDSNSNQDPHEDNMLNSPREYTL